MVCSQGIKNKIEDIYWYEIKCNTNRTKET